jgi:hypothetical protein
LIASSLRLGASLLIRAFGVIEQKKDRNGDNCVGAGAEKFVPPEQMEVGQAKKAMVNEKQQHAIDDGKSEHDDNTGQRAFYIDLKSNARRDIADGRLGHPVNPDGLIGKGVLDKPDDGSGEGSGDGAAPGDGKKKNDDEWQIEQVKVGKELRQKRLQQDRHQRNKQRDDGGEGVLLEFSSGCIAAIEHRLD